MIQNYKFGLFRTLWILREYLSEIVLGGGWVPFIYYHYLLKNKSIDPVRTYDIDLLVNTRIPVLGSKTIDELLLEAGLKSAFKTISTPPIIHYEGKIQDYEVEIEFLTDQRGSIEDIVVEVQKGLHAEALRYISVATENIIKIEIDDFVTEDGIQTIEVQVPSPAAYIFHKGLVFRKRREEVKKAKDLYYIFNILLHCEEIRTEINAGLNELKNKYPTWFNRFERNLDEYFSGVESDGVKFVSDQRIATDLPNLDENQFSLYVYTTFRELIGMFDNSR